MRALVLDERLQFRPDYPDPRPSPGEALIRVRVAGICRTDLELARGYMGFRGIPGHEFVGEVLRARDASLVGSRVVGEINCPCGACRLCRVGLGRHCPDRTVLGIQARPGAFADLVLLPEANLLVIPEDLPDEEAVFAEPLAAALEILEQVHVGPDARVAVLGDGKLGLLAAQVVARTGARTVLFGRHPEKMAVVRGAGIRTVLAGTDPELGPRPFDVVVEATGSWAGLEDARNLLRPRGVLVLKSTLAASANLNLSWLVVDEITLVGSRCGPFQPAVRLLESGAVRTRELIGGLYPFERWETAFREAAAPGAMKVLLDLRGGC